MTGSRLADVTAKRPVPATTPRWGIAPPHVFVGVAVTAGTLVYGAMNFIYHLETKTAQASFEIPDPLALIPETWSEHRISLIFWLGFCAFVSVIVRSNRIRAHEASLARARDTARAFDLQKKLNERLLEVDRRKDEFVSTVSHEFRTPLTGILGFSEMIRDEPLSVEEVKGFAGDINRDAQRLARMINDMLDLARLQSGGMRLSLVSVDLNAIVREVAGLFRTTAPRHQIDLMLDAHVPLITADHDRLTQVVTNLLSNGVKYSPDGGRILLRTSFDNDRIQLAVADSGIGIPADSLERVFEKFTRIDSKAMRDIQGTGLGLPIVRQIVEMHGGRVWAESELGKGTAIRVTFPIGRSGAAAASEPA